MQAITKTDFHFPGQTAKHQGKVRDIYFIDNELLLIITTDRISAFDVVLPRGIPFKGQVLNQIASKFLDLTKDAVPNWKIAEPDPMVTAGYLCKPFPIEMVIRGYLAGSAWRAYKNGVRQICGVQLPEGMKENEPFPAPIITPTTKATTGHDLEISPTEIIRQGLLTPAEYETIEYYTYELFKRGTEFARRRGLILVDTKYEFGKYNGQIFLIDEIHTPDSSRYYYLEGFEDRLSAGLPQRQLSKEFVREWLMANGFNGEPGQQIPEMTDSIVQSITDRYIELYEQLIGEKFMKFDSTDVLHRIERNVMEFLHQYRN